MEDGAQGFDGHETSSIIRTKDNNNNNNHNNNFIYIAKYKVSYS